MKITVLGCGGAGGVPMIGQVWGACDPGEPKNRRLRVSVLVEEGGQTILIDTSPDMRAQLLGADVREVQAIFYTHAHADHTHGIDNIRSLNWLTRRPMPVYADAETLAELTHRFGYIFEAPSHHSGGQDFTRPAVEPHVLTGPLTLGSMRITPFRQAHGASHSIGYRFNDFGYSTDVSDLDETAFSVLRGVKLWIVGCMRPTPHPSHAHVEKVLAWGERVGAEKIVLTHMGPHMDYATLCSALPTHVRPAYDGLVIEL